MAATLKDSPAESVCSHLTALGRHILQLGGQLLVLTQGLAQLLRERRLPRLLPARLLGCCLRLSGPLLSRLCLLHSLISAAHSCRVMPHWHVCINATSVAPTHRPTHQLVQCASPLNLLLLLLAAASSATAAESAICLTLFVAVHV